MKWVRLNMRFPGKCILCGKSVTIGKQALWARGVGVKHIECTEAENTGIPCIVCGRPAGCEQCEMADSCDTKAVSPLCICSGCNGVKEAMRSYTIAAAKKYPILK